MAFLNRVADVAEELGHHPEIFNVYGRVRLTLTTHDAGNVVTEKDHRLAAAIDALLEDQGVQPSRSMCTRYRTASPK